MTDPLNFDDLVAAAKEPIRRPEVGDIELTLLAALFTSPEAAARIISDTRPGDFYFARHREFAEAVFPALARGEHVDRVTLAAAQDDPKDDRDKEANEVFLTFADKVFALAAGDEAPTMGKVDAYLPFFVEAARLRLARHLVEKVGKSLEAGEVSPTEAAAQVFKTVAELEAARRLVGSFASEGDEWATYLAALEAKQDPGREHDFTGLDTGFDHFNRVTNGLSPALYVLGAAPGTGKTTWAKQVADHVVEAHDRAAVLFVSYEQSKDELRQKTLSRMSGIENRDLRRGRLDPTAEGWKKIEKAAESFEKVAPRLFILEGDRTTTVDRLRLAALQIRRLTEAEALLVVVDYLQIIPTEDEFRDTRNKVDFVVSELRRLARDLDASVLAVSSIGRASYESSRIDAFKESGGIEFTADVGLVMIKDKDKDKGEDTLEGIVHPWERVYIDVVKNRFGERGRIAFKYFKPVDRFVETGKGEIQEE